MTDAEFKPSWLRWPPNCCETCVGWSRDRDNEWSGRCHGSAVNSGDVTDARFRCQDFKRREDASADASA